MDAFTSVLGFLSSAGDQGKVLLTLVIILVAGKLMAEICERLRQPAVVGEILAGVIIGPSILNLIQPGEIAAILAEIGVIFLLFTVGLETRPSDIFKVGPTATIVAILGVILPFVAGWGLLSFWPGHSWIEAVFMGAAMVATSVGITARVLASMGLISLDTSRVILAAAVIDDIIGLLVLAVVSSLASGEVDYIHIGLIAFLAVAFTLLTVIVGSKTVQKVKDPIDSLKIGNSLFLFALVLCFGLATIANIIGIAGIVGAFLAGVAMSEATDGTKLHDQSQTLTEFTAPFFLVGIGMNLNLQSLLSMEAAVLALVVTVLAAITKVAGCGLGALSMGKRKAIQVGVGMIPRGEVGIVVAQIGLTLAAVTDEIYGVVVTMSVATTIIAPLLLKQVFKGEGSEATELFELDREIG